MSTFNILGSAKLNTPDGKNPPTASATTSTSDTTAGAASLSSGPGDDSGDSGAGAEAGGKTGKGTKTACQLAHDELEARLRDEEFHARSRGW